MNPFDVAAVLIAIAATAGYLNHRLLKLPATSGTLVVALLSSFVVVAAEAVFPGLQADIAGLLGEIAACLLLGAIISPTDPIAVMGLLKELKAPGGLAQPW